MFFCMLCGAVIYASLYRDDVVSNWPSNQTPRTWVTRCSARQHEYPAQSLPFGQSASLWLPLVCSWPPTYWVDKWGCQNRFRTIFLFYSNTLIPRLVQLHTCLPDVFLSFILASCHSKLYSETCWDYGISLQTKNAQVTIIITRRTLSHRIGNQLLLKIAKQCCGQDDCTLQNIKVILALPRKQCVCFQMILSSSFDANWLVCWLPAFVCSCVIQGPWVCST